MRKTALLLLAVFVFTIPWEDLVSISSVGTLSRIIGILAFAAASFLVFSTGRLRIPRHSHLLMILFVVVAALSYTWTVDVELTRNQISTYLQLLAMAWVIWQVPRCKREYATLMSAFVLGAYVASVSTITAYLSSSGADAVRYAAAGFDPNALGVILATGIPMAWYLALLHKRGAISWLYRLYLPMAFLSTLLTASRGAFIATVAALLIVPLTSAASGGARKRVALGIGLISAVALVSFVVPQTSWDRILTVRQEVTQGTLNSRTLIWQAGYDNFKQSPLLGVGSGAFKSSLGVQFSREFVVHNVFLSVLFEQGIVGLVVFAGLLLSLILGIRKLPALDQRLWSVLMLVWTIGGLSLTMEPRKITWLLWGLLAAQSALIVPTVPNPAHGTHTAPATSTSAS